MREREGRANCLIYIKVVNPKLKIRHPKSAYTAIAAFTK